MGLKPVRGRSRPRVGLVLGAGGVLGAAWMTGALPALQDRLPCPLGEVDLIIGTSAGSVIAAALRCGVSSMASISRADPRRSCGAGGQGPPVS